MIFHLFKHSFCSVSLEGFRSPRQTTDLINKTALAPHAFEELLHLGGGLTNKAGLQVGALTLTESGTGNDVVGGHKLDDKSRHGGFAGARRSVQDEVGLETVEGIVAHFAVIFDRATNGAQLFLELIEAFQGIDLFPNLGGR